MSTNELRDIRHAVRTVVSRNQASGINRSTVSEVIDAVAPVVEERVREELINAVLADVHGMGAIDDLLKDDKITDVLVVGGRGVWVERETTLHRIDVQLDHEEVSRLIERIIGPLGLHVDRSSPMVDARLPDGSRVHAVLPPVAVDGPCLTIRRFGARHVPLHQMAAPSTARILQRAVAERRNMLISGGTGVGKTTLLNALAAELPTDERIVTIEDTAELRIPLQHVVRLEARPPNAEGAGEVTVRQLIRTALRMRPDRLIVGEVRGAEAVDMLQAMNTGHRGSLSTCHASSAHGALVRLETMVLLAGVTQDAAAVRQQIATAVDMVVQMERSAGERRVVDIASVHASVDGSLVVTSLMGQP